MPFTAIVTVDRFGVPYKVTICHIRNAPDVFEAAEAKAVPGSTVTQCRIEEHWSAVVEHRAAGSDRDCRQMGA